MTTTEIPAPAGNLAARLGRALVHRGWRLVSAESCTGGLLAARLTDIPGASEWFEGAFVTYRLSAKRDMVAVPRDILDHHGPVSEPTARAMAEGALKNSSANVSVAITGVAGPEGGDPISPVGTVWFAWALKDDALGSEGIQCVQTAEHQLPGDRQLVREQAVVIALEGLLALVA